MSGMAGAGGRYPWAGMGGLWNPSWPPGSRNQNADSDTDSEHRRLREDRDPEEVTTSEDETLSHISAADAGAESTESSGDDTESQITVEDVHEAHEMDSDAAVDTASNDDTESHITVEDEHEAHEMDSDAAIDTASNDSDMVELASNDLAMVDLASNDSDTVELASNDLVTVDFTASHPVETSSTIFDPDETISEQDEEEPRLARNGYNHNVDNFAELYKKLHLRSEFYNKFHTLINEHHEDEEVKAAMMAGTDQGVKDVAAEFLDRYGQSIWKLKGKNSQQDRKKYRETLFDIKKDADRLIPILEELWFHVRDLLYVDARPAASSASPTSLLPVGPWTQYGNRDNPNLRAGPLPAEVPSRAAVPEDWEDGPEQKADEMKFLAKVKANRLGKK